MDHTSVLVVDRSQDPGIVTNAAFVLGLTAGARLPQATFGPEVVDGDGMVHAALTRIPHFVRKAGQAKLRRLRKAFSDMGGVQLVDYTEDAAPSDYAVYARGLAGRCGDDIHYRAIHVFGPSELIDPLTRNLSRL